MLRDDPIQDAFAEAVGDRRDYLSLVIATVELPVSALPVPYAASTDESELASGVAQ